MNPDPAALAERLKAFIREVCPGGCKMFSQGANCECPLCDVDRLAALRQRPQEEMSPVTPRLKGEPDYYAACLALIADTVDGMEPEKLEEKRHKLSAPIRMASHYIEKLRGEYDLRGSPPAPAERTTEYVASRMEELAGVVGELAAEVEKQRGDRTGAPTCATCRHMEPDNRLLRCMEDVVRPNDLTVSEFSCALYKPLPPAPSPASIGEERK